ncbi:MAG TPA: sugar ABC transporter ATP-binding protein [Anaerolineae bacterium]|nr:sugar ABC transporter ATP-binding protein [Anaerolineae bacterium]
MRLVNLSKAFPGVVAVSEVNLDIYPGQVMGLIGQNGAGKSTLIQILAGAHPFGSYQGQVIVGGHELRAATVADAEAAGIVLIPQEVNVVGDLTVAENILLNREPTQFGLIDWELLYAQARSILKNFGLDVNPSAKMASLAIATRQLVIIAKALYRNPRVLILDEPTASLTDVEAQQLFEHIRELRKTGVACIFVSHRLAEVFSIADRVVVMRDGKIQADHAVGSTTQPQVISEMMGSALAQELASSKGRESYSRAAIALRVENLNVYDGGLGIRPVVENLTLELHQGEILGMFGLVGAGCTEAVKAIFGIWYGAWSGKIYIYEKLEAIQHPLQAIQQGIGLLTEDRHEGLALNLSVQENIALASLPAMSSRSGFLDLESMRLTARQYVDRLNIKLISLDTAVETLSGGGQQKVMIARWLAAHARILLLDDPTRGVDVGARLETHRILDELAQAGHSILMISSDAEEVLTVCDRVLVMRRGRLVGEFAAHQMSGEQLVHIAAGAE